MFPTRTLRKNNTVYIFLHYHMTSAAGGQVALSLFIIMPPPPFTFNNILFPLLYNCLLHPMPPELRLCQTNLYHLKLLTTILKPEYSTHLRDKWTHREAAVYFFILFWLGEEGRRSVRVSNICRQRWCSSSSLFLTKKNIFFNSTSPEVLSFIF